MARPLPNFERPPVIEVALSVQFDKVEGLTTGHLGLLWSKYREHFPHCAEQPALEPVREVFGEKPRAGLQLRLSNPAADVRLWFLNEDQSELVQVQRDWFIRNWRRVAESNVYPRYPRLRESFENELSLFQEFLAEQKLPPIRPNQCEVIYVNHIRREGVWEHHGQLDSAVKYWQGQALDDIGPEPENVRLSTRYVLLGDDGKPQGRLHVEVDSAIRAIDDEPIFVLKLVARGTPIPTDINGVLTFLDRGRECIVRAFASITTPELQKAWGRTK